jgi:hypothetical protein
MRQTVPYTTVKDGLRDWYLWYREHRDDGRSIEQEIAFQKRVIDGLFDLIATAAQEIEVLKGQHDERPLLYVPTGRVRL